MSMSCLKEHLSSVQHKLLGTIDHWWERNLYILCSSIVWLDVVVHNSCPQVLNNLSVAHMQWCLNGKTMLWF